MENTIASIAEKIDSYRQLAIDFETAITKIPALGPENGGDGEKAKCEFLHGWLTANLRPDDLQEYRAPDDRVSYGYRPNLVAMFNGKSNKRTIWIMTHTDVVPPGDLSKWTSDPWMVRVNGDKLFGRGVEDNTQGMASSVLAVKALRELNLTPEYNVGLVLVSDEETGSRFGIQYLLNEHRELFSKEDIIFIPDDGNAKGTRLEVAEKSILWIRFHTVGKQTHGSTPELGHNAHKAACYLAMKMDTLHKKYGKRDPLFDPPISTFEPTKREANVPNVNTIPGEDVMYFDCRVLPSYKVSAVIKTIKQFIKETEKKFKVKIGMQTPQMEVAASPTSPEAPACKAIARAMKELRGLRTKPMGIGGGTVAKYFREAGFPAVVWSTMDEMAHNQDEYCLISNILEDAKVFGHVFMQGE
jgi:succinyl-diaminopimelate desuccinylase